MARGYKTGGREQGTPNKITADVREVLKNIVEDELRGLPDKLNELEGKDRLDIVVKLLPYVVPRLEAAEINLTEKIPQARTLTREEAKEFLKELEASC
jgi:hypothetical protein